MRKAIAILVFMLLPVMAQAQTALTLRKLTATKLALSIWRMPDGSVREVRLTQAEYTTDVRSRPPDPGALFLMAAGGIPALNTASQWPAPGDVWEQNGDLYVATDFGVNWGYDSAEASDPGRGSTSQMRVRRYASIGKQVRLSSSEYIGARPDKITLLDKTRLYDITSGVLTVQGGFSKTVTTEETKTVPNHKSVTFDVSVGAKLDGPSSI